MYFISIIFLRYYHYLRYTDSPKCQETLWCYGYASNYRLQRIIAFVPGKVCNRYIVLAIHIYDGDIRILYRDFCHWKHVFDLNHKINIFFAELSLSQEIYLGY